MTTSLPRAARKALLAWFAKREASPAEIVTQLFEDICIGDAHDLREHIAQRYGNEAADAFDNAHETELSDPEVAVRAQNPPEHEAEDARAFALLMALPAPLFVEALESARNVMTYNYDARHDAIAPDPLDYFERVVEQYRLPYRVEGESIVAENSAREERPASRAVPSDLVPDAADIALDLFGKSWRDIETQDLLDFLNATTEDEPLQWEVKGTALPENRDNIKKAVAGFGNREGGYLILGIEFEKATGRWELAPIEFPEDEPATWLSRFLKGISLPPEFDIRVLWRDGRRALAVIQVQPNVGSYSMVGRMVPERRPGETVWLEDSAAITNLQRRVESRSRSRPGSTTSSAQAQPAQGPPPAPAEPAQAASYVELAPEMAPEAFTAALKQLLAAGQTAEAVVFLAGSLMRIRQARDAGDEDALELELDRITDCAAVALVLAPESDVLRQALQVLRDAFDLGLGRLGSQDGAISAERLWQELLARVRALGALAVRLGRWEALRPLVLHEVHDGGPRLWPTWLRYGDIWVSRAELYRVENNVLETSRAPFRFAAGHAMRLPSLHPDGVDQEDELITAICQFDFFANLISASEVSDGRHAEAALPYYAAWDGERVRPAAEHLITNERIRAAVLGQGSDAELATWLRFLSERAHRASEGLGSWIFWDGFEEGRVRAFISKHLGT